jgi:hypothetical protein
MFTMSRTLRRTILTAHIVVTVGLLGDSAGFLAVAVQAATTTDPAVAHGSRETMEMFSAVFGIPLSVLSIVTGVSLGLVISVMAVGALVLGPNAGREGREGLVVAGAAYDVLALCLATGLSVFKPGRVRRAVRRVEARTLG